MALGLWSSAISCAGPTPGEAPVVPPGGVVLDGRFDAGEWSGEKIRADGRDLHLRLFLPEPRSLQASKKSVVVLLDLDDDPTTGGELDIVGRKTDARADLAIVFSPPSGGSRPGGRGAQGVAVLVLSDEDGPHRSVPHEDFGVLFAPTFAAREFELRISRHPTGVPELAALLARGRISARALVVARDKTVEWSEFLGSLELPPRVDGSGPLAVGVPERRADALRIVSWNVLFASPETTPGPFARILRALRPDIVLVQEWERATAGDLASWFAVNVGGEWNALDSPGWGVAIVSRGPLERLGPERIARPEKAPADASRRDAALRVAAAIVQTRLGAAAVASVHLKCCGGVNSPQDRTRIAEARRIRETLARAWSDLGEGMPRLRIIGGDLNLVGSNRPLAELVSGWGDGDTELHVAEAGVLGDRAAYTWRGRRSRFAPGRLDYLLYGGGDPVSAFVFDSEHLDAGALEDSGVRRDDSASSDHLALVLDVRPSPVSSVTQPP